MTLDRSASSSVRPRIPFARPRRSGAAAVVALSLALSAIACSGDDDGCSEPVRERSRSAGTLDAGPVGIARAIGQRHNAPIVQIMDEAAAAEAVDASK